MKKRSRTEGHHRPPRRRALAVALSLVILVGTGSAWADARAEMRPQRGRTGVALAWLPGEVILDGTPLAEAVSEMNRYDRRRRMVVDPAIAAVRISGVYHTGNLELFAAMVARLYGFRVTHRDGRIHLLAPTPTLTAEK